MSETAIKAKEQAPTFDRDQATHIEETFLEIDFLIENAVNVAETGRLDTEGSVALPESHRLNVIVNLLGTYSAARIGILESFYPKDAA
jgi:hypothetical protein